MSQMDNEAQEQGGQVVPDTQASQVEQSELQDNHRGLEVQVSGECFSKLKTVQFQVGSDYTSDSSVTSSEVERNEVMLAQELIPVGAEVEVVTDSMGDYKVQACTRLVKDSDALNRFKLACAEDSR